MQASQDGDTEMVKILTEVDGLEIDHASKVAKYVAHSLIHCCCFLPEHLDSINHSKS